MLKFLLVTGLFLAAACLDHNRAGQARSDAAQQRQQAKLERLASKFEHKLLEAMMPDPAPIRRIGATGRIKV